TQTIASLITLQAAPFHQAVAELAKFECTFVVAEELSGYDSKPQIRNARRIIIAVLDTKIHHAANYECAQVLVEEHCSRKKFRQETRFSRLHISGKQFTFSNQVFDRKDKLVICVRTLFCQQPPTHFQVRKRRGIGD